MIAIVEYGMGNIYSVYKNLIKAGADVTVTSSVQDILKADKIILPGVGHFGKAMDTLHQLDLVDPLNKRVLEDKVPVLGICLGMQLMAEESEEGNAGGLGWIRGKIVRFKVKDTDVYKVPHMGWNDLLLKKSNLLFNTIPSDSRFYFVHSYHWVCENVEDILASTTYEYEFTSVISKLNIFGTQFHPEKSHLAGYNLLRNFLRI